MQRAYRGDDTPACKVGGRMYACADMADFSWVAVKCDPDEALRLRDRYPEVTEAWHFNKRHWNGIRTDGDLPEAFIRKQIRNSYLLVVRQNVTPRSLREEIMRCIGTQGLPE